MNMGQSVAKLFRAAFLMSVNTARRNHSKTLLRQTPGAATI